MKLAAEIRVSRSPGGGLLNLFEERELFLRSGGRMRYVTLTRRMQFGILAVALLMVGWVGYSTATFVFHDRIIGARDDEVREAKLAYLDLLGEVSEYQDQYSALTDNLEANQGILEKVIKDDAALRERWSEIQDRLSDSKTERARIAMARSEIRNKLESFKGDLGDLDDRTGSLQSTIAALEGELTSAQGERDDITEAQAHLGDQLRSAELKLADSNMEVAKLERQIAELHSALTESEQERERLAKAQQSGDGAQQGNGSVLAESDGRLADLAGSVSELEGRLREAERERNRAMREQGALKSNVASLQRDLLDASHREERLTSQLDALAKTLEGAVAQRDELTKERDRLAERVRDLQVDLVSMQDSQDDVLHRLSEQTRLTIERAESMVATTGLDVDEMVSRVKAATEGQGGPYVPADGGMDIDSMLELPTTASLLESQMDRWELLQKVMAALPVIPPLDQFTISSTFGARKDPINGTSAFHSGLDMAAWYDTPVYAPAPGRVVFAGWRGKYGRLVEIDHGMGIHTRYGHLKKILVEVGDEVERRDKIGKVGSSGRSTGPHVHWEVRIDGKAVNPMPFLLAGKNVFQG
jgi:murein DD-endopeptidase MepM/ murein hydrolase activator NlpD